MFWSSSRNRRGCDLQGVMSIVNVSSPTLISGVTAVANGHLRLASFADPHTRVPGQPEVKDRRWITKNHRSVALCWCRFRLSQSARC
jgi:hypothetical protein